MKGTISPQLRKIMDNPDDRRRLYNMKRGERQTFLVNGKEVVISSVPYVELEDLEIVRKPNFFLRVYKALRKRVENSVMATNKARTLGPR